MSGGYLGGSDDPYARPGSDQASLSARSRYHSPPSSSRRRLRYEVRRRGNGWGIWRNGDYYSDMGGWEEASEFIVGEKRPRKTDRIIRRPAPGSRGYFVERKSRLVFSSRGEAEAEMRNMFREYFEPGDD